MGPSQIARSDGRDQRGKFAPGNVAALKSGAHSEQVRSEVLQSEQAQAALADRRAVVEADLGGSGELSSVKRDMVRRYCELDALANWFVERLLAKGPLTTADRTRQMLGSYLQVLDRQYRLATLVGLERRAKKAPTVRELMCDMREGS